VKTLSQPPFSSHIIDCIQHGTLAADKRDRSDNAGSNAHMLVDDSHLQHALAAMQSADSASALGLRYAGRMQDNRSAICSAIFFVITQNSLKKQKQKSSTRCILYHA
jgi:hypothetical protein